MSEALYAIVLFNLSLASSHTIQTDMSWSECMNKVLAMQMRAIEQRVDLNSQTFKCVEYGTKLLKRP